MRKWRRLFYVGWQSSGSRADLGMPEWTGGGSGRAMEVDDGTVDYWQTCTCKPCDAIAYTSVKISAWTSSFFWGGEGAQGARLLNGGGAPGPPSRPWSRLQKSLEKDCPWCDQPDGWLRTGQVADTKRRRRHCRLQKFCQSDMFVADTVWEWEQPVTRSIGDKELLEWNVPTPNRRSIKRCFYLTAVCLSRTSDAPHV